MTLNLNVGVLGHVDCGKTSLVKALSSVLSTASLDKNPQSRERGITLDLGFSSFTVAVPDHLSQDAYSCLQFTLVDCPGHASLIRTIIGGAQIMDMMLLVVDVNKGMQAQTMECVVIGEAVMAKSKGTNVIIVLNKIDLIPEAEREQRIQQAKKDITVQLLRTELSHASIVCCAAAVGGEKIAAPAPRSARDAKRKAEKGVGGHTYEAGSGGQASPFADTSGDEGVIEGEATFGVAAVVAELILQARVPNRRVKAPLYFAFDHCFSVRGVGTILTGTMLAGEVKVNQFVEFPALQLQKKVKSMQMFHKPVTIARAGDRVGLCLAGLDAKLLERGVASAPGSVRPVTTALALVRKVLAFSGQCRSGGYYHVSLGHATAMATVTFFGAKELKEGWRTLIPVDTESNLSLPDEGWQEGNWSLDDMANLPFSWGAEYAQQPELLGNSPPAPDDSMDQDHGQPQDEKNPLQYCLIQFHTSVITPPSSVILGSRLDTMVPDASSAMNLVDSGYLESSGQGKCRIAFHGRLLGGAIGDGKRATPEGSHTELGFGTEVGKLKLFNEKVKRGVVFRVGGGNGTREQDPGHALAIEVFGKDLFKKETNMSPFIGMLLHTEEGVVGHIEGAFGKAGRFRACFPCGTSIKVGDKLLLKFRKYVRDASKTMDQSYIRKSLEASRLASSDRAQGFQPSPSDDSIPSPRVGTISQPAGKQLQNSLREGRVDRVKVNGIGEEAGCVAVCSGLFSQEEDIRELARLGKEVLTSLGMKGNLLGPFGKVGKCKIEFEQGTLVQVGDRVYLPR